MKDYEIIEVLDDIHACVTNTSMREKYLHYSQGQMNDALEAAIEALQDDRIKVTKEVWKIMTKAMSEDRYNANDWRLLGDFQSAIDCGDCDYRLIATNKNTKEFIHDNLEWPDDASDPLCPYCGNRIEKVES